MFITTTYREKRLTVSVLLMLMLFAGDVSIHAEENRVFDGKRAFQYLVDICRIGPRVSGTRGMARQQQLILAHFKKLGAKLQFQSFDATHPISGQPVRLNNLIVTWHPESTKRVLIGCHYDTRPFPDRDRFNPQGRFIGANDGASGVALLMELGHHLPKLKTTYGVDFIFFDAEELIYGKRGKYFLGSEYFAKQYRAHPPKHKYVCGVIVDMVADKNLNLYMERKSLKFAPAVTKSIWKVAEQEGVSEFIATPRHDVEDDHVPLNEIAQIPTCDIIDFDYPHWHTTRDVPSNCSGESLAKVGQVLMAWLQAVPDFEQTGN